MTASLVSLEPFAWQRVLVLAPHPDDETLATGGLLQRAVAGGGSVRIVFVTDGEDNPWPQRVLERRWRIGATGRTRWAARRQVEALAAIASLGVPTSSAVFLRCPDQRLTHLLLAGDDTVVSRLAAELTAWRPTLVAAPAVADRHPDHSALALLWRRAVERIAVTERAFVELAYIVHGDVPSPLLDLRLTPDEQARKRAAIACHRSQLVLSRRRFLAHAQPTERFVDPASYSRAHRVRAATFACGSLSIVLAPPTSLATVLPATLDVVVEDCEGTLRRHSRRVLPRQRVVVLPLETMPVRLLARCEGPHLFFDRAGWREMRPAGEAKVIARPPTEDRAAAGLP